MKTFPSPLDWMPRSKSQAHDELSSIRKTLLITRDSNGNSIPSSLFNQLDKFSMCLHNYEEGKESKSSENLALPEDSLFFSFSVVYCRNCLFVLMSSTTFFFNSLVFISILRLFRFLFPAPHSDTIPISSQHSVFSALVSLVCYATFTISVSPSEQYIYITEWEMAARNKNL